MRVDPHDVKCRSCQGPLDSIDFDDCSLSVACLKYHFPLVARQMLGGGDDAE